MTPDQHDQIDHDAAFNEEMLTENGEEIIWCACPKCGDNSIGWPEDNGKLCLDCCAQKLFEEDALWSEEDERRMDIIGSNGNDGDNYE